MSVTIGSARHKKPLSSIAWSGQKITKVMSSEQCLFLGCGLRVEKLQGSWSLKGLFWGQQLTTVSAQLWSYHHPNGNQSGTSPWHACMTPWYWTNAETGLWSQKTESDYEIWMRSLPRKVPVWHSSCLVNALSFLVGAYWCLLKGQQGVLLASFWWHLVIMFPQNLICIGIRSYSYFWAAYAGLQTFEARHMPLFIWNPTNKQVNNLSTKYFPVFLNEQ